jgi:hypothetical protein
MSSVIAIPVAPAPEDMPDWYATLRRSLAGEQLDPTTVQAAHIAALAFHDLRESQLARLNAELAAAANAAMLVGAELTEWRAGCELHPR